MNTTGHAREASENFFRIAISHASCWLLPLIDGKKIMPQPGRVKFLSVKSNQTESLRPDARPADRGERSSSRVDFRAKPRLTTSESSQKLCLTPVPLSITPAALP